MKDFHALIIVTMLVITGGSIAEFVANHKALFIGLAIVAISGLFIYSVIKNAKISK